VAAQAVKGLDCDTNGRDQEHDLLPSLDRIHGVNGEKGTGVYSPMIQLEASRQVALAGVARSCSTGVLQEKRATCPSSATPLSSTRDQDHPRGAQGRMTA